MGLPNGSPSFPSSRANKSTSKLFQRVLFAPWEGRKLPFQRSHKHRTITSARPAGGEAKQKTRRSSGITFGNQRPDSTRLRKHYFENSSRVSTPPAIFALRLHKRCTPRACFFDMMDLTEVQRCRISGFLFLYRLFGVVKFFFSFFFFRAVITT